MFQTRAIVAAIHEMVRALPPGSGALLPDISLSQRFLNLAEEAKDNALHYATLQED
jgi:hypothetical protein